MDPNTRRRRVLQGVRRNKPQAVVGHLKAQNWVCQERSAPPLQQSPRAHKVHREEWVLGCQAVSMHAVSTEEEVCYRG
jgi:hypothetical protein